MTNTESTPVTDKTLAQRARLNTLVQRRRRLFRRLLLFALITAGMIYVVVLNRDSTQLRLGRNMGQRLAAAFEKESAARSRPLLTFPSDSSLRKDCERLYFNVFYAGQAKERPEAGVCCLKEPMRFFLRREGRIVILFNGKNYLSRWMPEDEFQSAAKELGFGYLLGE